MGSGEWGPGPPFAFTRAHARASACSQARRKARALLEAPGAVPAGHMLRAALAGGALSDQEAARVLLLHLQVLHLKPPAPAPSLLLPLPMSLLYTSSVDNS